MEVFWCCDSVVVVVVTIAGFTACYSIKDGLSVVHVVVDGSNSGGGGDDGDSYSDSGLGFLVV